MRFWVQYPRDKEALKARSCLSHGAYMLQDQTRPRSAALSSTNSSWCSRKGTSWRVRIARLAGTKSTRSTRITCRTNCAPAYLIEPSLWIYGSLSRLAAHACLPVVLVDAGPAACLRLQLLKAIWKGSAAPIFSAPGGCDHMVQSCRAFNASCILAFNSASQSPMFSRTRSENALSSACGSSLSMKASAV